MNCEEYVNLMDDLIERAPDVQNSAAVGAHLLVCAECAAYDKTARREKEIYAVYLSEIEPPADLWAKFQAKVNAASDAISPVPETAAVIDRKRKFFGFFRLYPSLGFAASALMIGFVWFGLAPDKTKYVAETKLNNAPAAVENYHDQTSNLPLRTGSAPVLPAITETGGKTGTVRKRTNDRILSKKTVTDAVKTNGKITPGDQRKESPIESNLNERQKQLLALEKAAARQIEKTELLLRSFRNARADVGDAIDLEYESRQARRLLEINVKLRQTAENYGDLSTLEILDRVEPFLLDIANLEKSPLPEKVSDIKARVKNQNIIASLQIY